MSVSVHCHDSLPSDLCLCILPTDPGSRSFRFLQLEQLSEQRDEAMAEWSRLQIEQATFADASRVEQIARERLGMLMPEHLEILVIEP